MEPYIYVTVLCVLLSFIFMYIYSKSPNPKGGRPVRPEPLENNPGNDTSNMTSDEEDSPSPRKQEVCQSDSSQLTENNQDKTPNQACNAPNKHDTDRKYEVMVSESDITDVINLLRPSDLQHLYIELHLKTPEIEAAEGSTGTFDVKMRARRVLNFWRQQHGQNASRKVLLEALESCRLKNSKEELQEKWKTKETDLQSSLSVLLTTQNQRTQILPQHQMTAQGSPSTSYSTTAVPRYNPTQSQAPIGCYPLQQDIPQHLMQPFNPSLQFAPQQDLPFDLSTCQKTLKAIYKTRRSGIGFLPGFPKEFSSDEFFVDLQLTKEQKTTTQVEHIELKTYVDLLKVSDKKGQRLNHVLVSGLAGTGKTTLISRLAYQWATADETDSNGASKSTQEHLVPLSRFELVFALDIRAFKPHLDLVNTVLDQLLHNYSSCKSDLEYYLLANADKCLYLLDGYDELYSASGRVLNSTVLCGSCVIVTSRPNTVDRFNNTNPGYVQVLLKGFSQSNVCLFVTKYFNHGRDEDMCDNEEAKQMIAKIQNTKFISTISSFPLMLAMMCLIWQDYHDLHETVTSLYKQVLEYMTVHWKARDDSFASISFERFKENVNTLLVELGKIALDGLMRSKLIFQEIDFGSTLVELACNLGVVSCDKQRVRFHKVTYVSFIHKTFQEFCAAMYLTSLAESEQELFKSYLSKMNVQDMDYVLKFACGISQNAAKFILQHLVIISSQSKIKDIEDVIKTTWDRDHNLWRLPLILLYEAESQTDVKHQSLHRTLESLVSPFILPWNLAHDSEYTAVLTYFENNSEIQAKWFSFVTKTVIDCGKSYQSDRDSDLKIKLLTKLSGLSSLAVKDCKPPKQLPQPSPASAVCLEATVKSTTFSKVYLKVARDRTSKLLAQPLPAAAAAECDASYKIFSKMTKIFQAMIESNTFSRSLKKLTLFNFTSYTFDSLNAFLAQQTCLEILQFVEWQGEFQFAFDSFPQNIKVLQFNSKIGYPPSKVKLNLEGVQCLNNTNLISFEMKNAIFQNQSVDAFCMLRLPKLRILILDNCSDEHSEKAFPLQHIHTPELRELVLKNYITGTHLSETWMKNKGSIALSKLIPHIPHLDKLNLARNEIGVEVAVALAQNLHYTPHMAHLDLCGINMGNDGLIAHSTSLHHIPQLKHLDLSRNKIGNDGLIALSKSLHHIPQLSHLDLSLNEDIEDDGVVALASSFHDVPLLTTLDLDTHGSYGPVGLEAVFRNLVYLRQLDSLQVTYQRRILLKCSALLKACIQELDWNINYYETYFYKCLEKDKINKIINIIDKYNV